MEKTKLKIHLSDLMTSNNTQSTTVSSGSNPEDVLTDNKRTTSTESANILLLGCFIGGIILIFVLFLMLIFFGNAPLFSVNTLFKAMRGMIAKKN